MRRALALGLTACLVGCAGSRTVSEKKLPELHGDIAVLPFDSMTTSLRGPDLLREYVHKHLLEMGQNPIPLLAVDDGLRKIGISDGGQLRSVTTQAVGTALGVDRYVVGNVADFSDQNIGFVRRRLVNLELTLIEAQTGTELWKNTGRVEKTKAALSKKQAKKSFLEGILENAAEKAYGKPMDKESRLAVNRVMQSFPRR